ncbi:MAG TPA: BTAD domain-containing putative transcriptional regulator, partial [Saprospiraceae bacterium]|nr:BTAD domain-containing putative transcriptional regulator [Saprospiraceae bacterium]
MSTPALKILMTGHHNGLLNTLRKTAAHHPRAEVISASPKSIPDLQHDDIGMVLVLHNPPESDGLSGLREWKRRYPHAAVIVATSDTSFQTTNQIWRAGACDVLSLTSNEEQILSCLEAYCSGFQMVAHPTASSVGVRNNALLSMMAATVPGLIALPLETLPPAASSDLPLRPDVEVSEAVFRGLEVNFFGAFTARLFGKPVVLTKQAEQIFAYLVYHHRGKALSREHLGKVFWPEKHEFSPEGARRSLNVEITKIRKSLRTTCGQKREFIVHQNQRYQMEDTLEIASDIDRFKAILSEVKKAVWEGREVSNDLFREALLIYHGNFMENCAVESHSWVEIERHRLSNDFLELALCYGEQLYRQGDYTKTAAVCRDILQRDNCLEVIHRRLMDCYYRLGMCDKALEQYRRCCTMMEHEFQSKPSPETIQLFQL